MRALFLILGCSALTAGCTGFVQPSELRPPAHPLLASMTRSTPGSPGARARASRPSRRRVAARAAAALGRAASDDAVLLRAAFGAHPLASVTDSDAAWAATEPRSGRARPGDLLVFVDDGHGPRTGVVLKRKRGVIEAAAVVRGKVRRVRVHRDRPTARRLGGRLVNTFLRARRRDDPAGARYLAGARLLGVRRY